MPKNLFGEDIHTAQVASYPAIENAPVFGLPFKGFRAVYDAPENGYVNWKAICAACERQWGEWEEVDKEWLLRFPAPDYETITSAVMRRLVSLGFKRFINGTVLCPPCNGQVTTIKSLSETVAPKPNHWFSEGNP